MIRAHATTARPPGALTPRLALLVFALAAGVPAAGVCDEAYATRDEYLSGLQEAEAVVVAYARSNPYKDDELDARVSGAGFSLESLEKIGRGPSFGPGSSSHWSGRVWFETVRVLEESTSLPNDLLLGGSIPFLLVVPNEQLSLLFLKQEELGYFSVIRCGWAELEPADIGSLSRRGTEAAIELVMRARLARPMCVSDSSRD